MSFAEEFVKHGTKERQERFAQLFIGLLTRPGMPQLDSVSIFRLLSVHALEWPGEENEYWREIVGLAVYFYVQAVQSGEIDIKALFEQLKNKMGNA